MRELNKDILLLRLVRAIELLYNVLKIMKAQADLNYIESIFDLTYNINYNDEVIICDGSSLQIDIASYLDDQGLSLAEVMTDNIKTWLD